MRVGLRETPYAYTFSASTTATATHQIHAGIRRRGGVCWWPRCGESESGPVPLRPGSGALGIRAIVVSLDERPPPVAGWCPHSSYTPVSGAHKENLSVMRVLR